MPTFNEIQEKMLKSVSKGKELFETDFSMDKNGGGFNLEDTYARRRFWSEVELSSYPLFNNLYPKTKEEREPQAVPPTPISEKPLQKRFKTEEEFIDTLGIRWRYTVNKGWANSMDSMFGLNYPEANTREWSVSDEMLTDLPLIGELKERVDKINAELKERVDKINAEQAFRNYIKQKLTVTKNGNGYDVIYKYNGVYSTHFEVCLSPTGNCQFSSIVSFNQLLSKVLDDKVIKIILKILFEQFFNKRMLFIDVNQTYKERVTKNFEFLWAQDYHSTNGSEMFCGMILCNKF